MTIQLSAFNKPTQLPDGRFVVNQPLDRLIRKEVMLGVIREIVKPEDHIGLQLFPFYNVPSDDYIFSYVKGLTTGLAPATAESAESELAQKDSGLSGQGRASLIDWRLKDHYDAGDVQRFVDIQMLAESGALGPGGLPSSLQGDLNQFPERVARDTVERRRRLDNRMEWLHMQSISNGGVAYNDGNISFAVDWKRPADQHAQAPLASPDNRYDIDTHDPINDINKIKRLMYDRYGVIMDRAICSNKFLLSLINSSKFIVRAGMGVAGSTGAPEASDLPYVVNNWGPQVAIDLVKAQTGIEFIEYDSGYRSKNPFDPYGAVTFNRYLPENRIIFLPSEASIREFDSSPIGFGKMMTSPHTMGGNAPGFYDWEQETTDPWGRNIGTGIKAFPLFPHMELSYTMDVVL
ncbi:major capsid protein [Gordonia phage Niagara]|nr:major capsid protein [Gordonia phage Niagara]